MCEHMCKHYLSIYVHYVHVLSSHCRIPLSVYQNVLVWTDNIDFPQLIFWSEKVD